MKLRLTSLLAALLLSPAAARADGTIEAHTLSNGDESPYPYAVWLPPGYDADAVHKYPLVMFIHGLGECGDGTKANILDKQTVHGPLKLIKKGSTYFTDQQVIVVAPQVPSADGWFKTDKLAKQVDYFLGKYRVNRKRVYTTGVSMGGGGTWEVSKPKGAEFAAILPICGAADPKYTKDFSAYDGLPTWAFHAWGDGTVSRSNTIGWANGIAAQLAGGSVPDLLDGYPHVGGNDKPAAKTMTGLFSDKKWAWKEDVVTTPGAPLRVTFYADGAHDSWTRTYDKPEVWDWLLSQQRYNGQNNDAPVAAAGADQSVEGAGSTVQVTLDGQNSYDPDGTIKAYTWTENGKQVATGANPSADLDAGTHTLTLTVTDDNGAQDTDEVTVEVKAGSGAGGNAGTGSGEGGSGGQPQAGQAGSGQAGSGQAGSGAAGSGQAGSGEAGSGNAGSGDAGSGEAGSGNAGSGNAGSGNAGSGQAGGKAGSSGTSGQGGKAGTGGASAGAAGKSTGGTAGSAATAGKAGTAGAAGAAGKSSGSSGKSGVFGGAAGQGGGADAADEGSGDGGGCSAAPRGAVGAGGWGLLGLLGLVVGRRRSSPSAR